MKREQIEKDMKETKRSGSVAMAATAVEVVVKVLRMVSLLNGSGEATSWVARSCSPFANCEIPFIPEDLHYTMSKTIHAYQQ